MKATLISIVPRQIRENIPGLAIGTYMIPPASEDNPRLLVVNDTFYFMPQLTGDPIKVTANGLEIAKGIVFDYCSSQVGYGEDAQPGLFYAEGECGIEKLMVSYKEKLEVAIQQQRNWFKNLVRIADDDFTQTRRHTVVSELQRFAAGELYRLGIDKREREWTSSVVEETKPKCPACGFDLPITDPAVCGHCKAILNPKKAREFGLIPPLSTNAVTGKVG